VTSITPAVSCHDFEVEHFLIDGDHATAEIRFHCVHRETGVPIDAVPCERRIVTFRATR
jgi:hypothetical protein